MKENITKRIFTALLVVGICILLIQGMGLSHEDKSDSPLTEFYVENYEETGAINLVEAILFDYRGYDTFGELLVLYIAITGVIILGKEIIKPKGEDQQADDGGEED